MYYLGQIETGPESGDGVPRPVPSPAPPPIYVQAAPPQVSLIPAQPVLYASPQMVKAQQRLTEVRQAAAQVKGEYEQQAKMRDRFQASRRREIENRALDLADSRKFYAAQLEAAKDALSQARTPTETRAANLKLYEVQNAAQQSVERQETRLRRARLELRDSIREEVAQEKEARHAESALAVEETLAIEAVRRGNRAALAAVENMSWGGR